jgi:hypothetical protein
LHGLHTPSDQIARILQRRRLKTSKGLPFECFANR